jgi:ferrous iron transport protein B
MKESITKVALAGNPNSGKSSVFNLLSGLRQHVSNFPGVTVDRKSAKISLSPDLEIILMDLPGTYSLYPNASDERIVVNILTNAGDKDYPDLLIYIADSTQLERHMLLATQIADLGFPMIFVLNMMDVMQDSGVEINVKSLETFLQIPVIPFSGRTYLNLDLLKAEILKFCIAEDKALYNRKTAFYMPNPELKQHLGLIAQVTGSQNIYLNKLLAHHSEWMPNIHSEQKNKIADLNQSSGFKNLPLQVEETLNRFSKITVALKTVVSNKASDNQTLTDRIDNIITHRVAGPLIFMVVMFLVFQAIFSWATIPMDWIEGFFSSGATWMASILPEAWFSDLLVNGIWAGLGGVVVFVPQIAILFFLISVLEESGYMSRAVFMFDGLMQRFGMNGRSIVALISSGACAIPAIMSTRTISNPKERLITILVSPFISCSARIPVYAILVGFVVPPDNVFGIFNLQGIVFMGLYLLGILAAFLTALIFRKTLKNEDHSSLLMELPVYKAPMWTNVLLNVRSKVMSFVTEAGKIIVMIAVVLWFLASYGPGDRIEVAESKAIENSASLELDDQERENMIAAYRIEASYAGIMGKWLEPAIRPLGFDWKIGIALITSFAAREVFVGTMATIYSIGSADDEASLRERMSAELKADNKTKRFDMPTSLALLIFYVFAMQCMSTLAVVRKETGSWKWPLFQFVFMGGLAYLGALVVYQILS